MTHEEIRQFMRSLRARLQSVKSFLDNEGYVFDYPEEALPGVSSNTEDVLLRITSAIGPIPLALVEFYREIGSVNFCGQHQKWKKCEYPDPLVIYPPEAAISELEEFLVDRTEYTEAYGGFRIPIAPDYYHKADVSGGMWYGVAVPAESANPIVLEERHALPFLEYLELNMEYGGFLGLERETVNSSWPLEELRKAARQTSE